MIQSLMVDERGGTYYKIPDAEVEDWEEILDAIDEEAQLIERIQGWAALHPRLPPPELGCLSRSFRSQD
jgi:hypothetical protein